MSWLSEALHGGKNPADAAMPYLQEIPGTVKPYLEPYSAAGGQARDVLQQHFQDLLSDPQAFINKIMEGYEPSSGYQARRDELTGQAANTAAAGGFRGTESDIKNQSDIVNRLMSSDMQDWLKNVLGAYQTGLGGESDIMKTGYGASSDLASTLANVLGSEASAQYRGQESQQQNRNQMLRSALELGSAAFGGSGNIGMDSLPTTMAAAGGMFF